MTSKVRHRRTKSEMPFADALSAATKRLSRATKEREQAQKSLTSLNAEIPNLQRTIAALKSQLGNPTAVPAQVDQRREAQLDMLRNNIPDDIRALAPPDDLTGMGSTRAVDEDVLPDAEGQEVLPE